MKTLVAPAYALCTACCFVMPESTVAYLSTVFLGIDLTGIYRQITWGAFLAGLLGSGLGMAVVAGATAWLYNRLARTPVSETSTLASQRNPAETGRSL